VNVKKGQFVSPPEMENAVRKLREGGAAGILLTERGSSFGYNNLVVDFRGLPQMRALAPVVMDATHSVQMPGALGTSSGGQREYVPVLARAAVAVGVDALFMEIHENPEVALSDGPNMVPVRHLEQLLTELLQLHQVRHAAEPVDLEG
jgi:2-dehydro-3-deoxyphosphooctonate aldolase (KDO 8-P synthase)